MNLWLGRASLQIFSMCIIDIGELAPTAFTPTNSQLSTVNSQQSTVNSQQSTVNSQQSTVNSQQSTD
ncbi:hypothetical protein [Microcoleus sp. bin38.metabat.b11b12b14.051]|uniref:hypothetical protein n=1 Tax=Microcoleus sp. bin38.metabat.b11b12b14.051 TaxID=2742709 RepID=UPI0025DEBE70|nr:hypothetical protein [Microcoleus sp. bin38.metabat.b11b12b14.051]